MQSVLLVDDEPLVLDATKQFLERFGNMGVQTAQTPKQAFDILKRSSFDAIVLDYYLPDINGIAFLKILRTKGDTTPVIIFTGVGRENAAIEALNNGADFFLKKGETPSSEFRELVHMIKMAAERRQIGRALGTTQKVLSDTVRFFSDAAYAIDRENRVIAWNKRMAELTGIAAEDIIGKSDAVHAIPFFGWKEVMLTELVLADDERIEQENYTILSRDETTICAWTPVKKDDGTNRVLWMKAAPLYDAKGLFIGALGSVRDVSDDIGPDLLRQAATADTQEADGGQKPDSPALSENRVLKKILGQGKNNHQEGLVLLYRQQDYAGAVRQFDKAIRIDPSHAAAWYDRAVCFRELGEYAKALQDFARSVELAPESEEFMAGYADMLRRAGILHGDKQYIEEAVKVFNHIVGINPNNADAWYSMGTCMKELGKEILASLAFERANDLSRNNKAWKKTRNLDTQL